MHDLAVTAVRGINQVFLDGLTTTAPGKKLFLRLADPYLAGHSLAEGVSCVAAYADQRRHSTLDILGEESQTREEADAYLAAYRQLMTMLRERFPSSSPATLSTKPSTICAVNVAKTATLPQTPLPERLEELVIHAAIHDLGVTLDMEDHHWTDASLIAARRLWDRGYGNLGIVLQSRLYRTESDIHQLFANRTYAVPRENIRVRVVIGIYLEPPEIAATSKRRAKELLIRRIGQLFDAGVYVEIATHDHAVIRAVQQGIITPRRIPPSRFEFQFLKGVENAYRIEPELLAAGYTVRYYLPIELSPGDGIPYMMRRLKANPTMVPLAAKNMVQALMHGARDGNLPVPDHSHHGTNSVRTD